jgi:hypothetical protein
MLSRRETLRGGSAAVVGIAVSGTVAARVAVEDPVIALRNERERLHNWMNSLPSTLEGDDQRNSHIHDLCVIEARLIEAEPTTFAGALAQIEQLAEWHRDGITYVGDDTIQPLLARLPGQIERLAGDAS